MPLLELAALCFREGQLLLRPACSCETDNPVHHEYSPKTPHRQTDRWGLNSASWESREGTSRNLGSGVLKLPLSSLHSQRKRGLAIFFKALLRAERKSGRL